MPALLDRRIDALRASRYRQLDAHGRAPPDQADPGLLARSPGTAYGTWMHGRHPSDPHAVNPAPPASAELIEPARPLLAVTAAGYGSAREYP